MSKESEDAVGSANAAGLARLVGLECPDATYRPTHHPLVFDRAQGSHVYDVEGRSYVDLCAGFGVLALGHNPPELRDIFTATDAIQHGMGDVYPSAAKIDLLERLVACLPARLDRAALALSGGQAVELALKTAMLATKAAGFIVFDGGYHGLDLGVLATTARQAFRSPFRPWLAEDCIERLPFGCGIEAIDVAIRRLEERGVGFAGILVEPVQGRAGVRPARDEWLTLLATAAHRQNGLLILDEIFTGLGRLGLISTAERVDCDITCLGKALGGGLPLSACVGTRAVMDAWPESCGEALHTGTFFGHPLACRLGTRVLEELLDQGLAERAATLGQRAIAFLEQRFSSDVPTQPLVRGRGLMIGIDFHTDGRGARIMDLLRAEGVLALAGGERGEVLSLSPALNIPEELLFQGLAAVCEAASTSC